MSKKKVIHQRLHSGTKTKCLYNADNPQKYEFSGSRIRRGLYRTSTGFEFNADVNGALNILRKSNVVSLLWLYSRGGVDTPARIRVF